MAHWPRLALCIWAALSSCAAAADFPYNAQVIADRAEVRSGPGDHYYAVLRLGRGETVEVYRHDAGEWCAIRPPEQAFSWVSAEFVEPRDDGIGVITGNHVSVRVGTTLDDTRDVIQVRLDRGEEVQIIEARELHSATDLQTWYKIAPPAGEFRWISRKLIENKSAQRTRAGLKRHSHRRSDVLDEAAADDDDDDVVRPAAHEEPTRRKADHDRKHRKQDADDAEVEPGDSPDDAPLPGPVRSYLSHRRPKTDLKEEAADLDLALSAIVAQEIADWDFTTLRRQTDAALERADTAAERGHVRRVLRKLDNFADIQQRYAVATRRADRRDRNDHSPARRGVFDASPLAARGDDHLEPRFDGEGRLTQIETIDPKAPHFALLDASGQVAAYVSPAPGVNLRRYLNQEVGIHGTRSYLADRQARHLTARRIETLGDVRLR